MCPEGGQNSAICVFLNLPTIHQQFVCFLTSVNFSPVRTSFILHPPPGGCGFSAPTDTNPESRTEPWPPLRRRHVPCYLYYAFSSPCPRDPRHVHYLPLGCPLPSVPPMVRIAPSTPAALRLPALQLQLVQLCHSLPGAGRPSPPHPTPHNCCHHSMPFLCCSVALIFGGILSTPRSAIFPGLELGVDWGGGCLIWAASVENSKLAKAPQG